jgi:phospholipid/cholesterol/gamma-HCH transport system substrate-binding protein
MDVEARYSGFPEDTAASIYTAGLLGEQYVALEPGGSDEVLHDGSQIELTQSALVLEKLVSKFLFDKAAEGGEKK